MLRNKEATALLFAISDAFAVKTLDGFIAPNQVMLILDLAQKNYRRLMRGEKIKVNENMEIGLESDVAKRMDQSIVDW